MRGERTAEGASRPPPPPTAAADLTSLALFVSAADLGSLSRAAQHHGVSQPAASNRLAALERRLGTELLRRGPTGSTTTPHGEALLPWARRAVDAACAFEDAAQRLLSSEDRALTIVASSLVGDHLLPRWVSSVGADEQRTVVSVRNSPEALGLVREGHAELGFLCLPTLQLEPDAPIEAIELGRDELVVVVAPDHPWAAGSPPSLAELARTAMVERDGRSATRAHLDRLLSPHRTDPPPPPVVELSSTGALRAAVLDGVAPAVLGRLSVRSDLDAGRLVEVAVDGFDEVRHVYVVWRAGAVLSPQAHRFVRYVTSPRARRAVGLV